MKRLLKNILHTPSILSNSARRPVLIVIRACIVLVALGFFSIAAVNIANAKVDSDGGGGGVDLTKSATKSSICTASGGKWSDGTCTHGEPVYELEDQLIRHLYYRAMWACFHDGWHKDERSASQISKGEWDPDKHDGGAGYLTYRDNLDWNDKDGLQDCDGEGDNNYIVMGSQAMGFANPIDMLCEMNRTGPGGPIINPNGSDCEESQKFKLDDGGGSDKALSHALTDAKNNRSDVSAPWSMQDIKVHGKERVGAAYYLLMRRSLEAFCGSDHASLSEAGDFDNDDDYVLVDQVEFASGEIYGKSKAYQVGFDGRKDSDTVKAVYWAKGNGGTTANNYACKDMASSTREWSNSFSLYIIQDFNEVVAANAKVGLSISDSLRTAEPGCKNKSKTECNKIISAKWIAAVDKCKTSDALNKPMKIDARADAMKTCLKKELPNRYNNAIDGVADPTLEEGDKTTAGDSDATQCNIPKTGWIICPVLDTMSYIADQAFNFLSDNFLKVDSKLFDTNGGTFQAWKTFRDIANLAFVIAIMVVIYSQLTGAGISNYGIKKLLPKIIIAAILVNLSYFICQLAVDISNILGYTLRDFFDSISGKIKLPGGDISSATSDTNGSPLGWVGIVAAITIGATLVWLFLGALIPVMVAAIIAMFMILFILLARKALIVLLIALSPLAFVAYLLPNTEQWFDRWRKTFFQLLMVFPIIAVVFGASGLASKIVAAGAGDDDIMLRIIAAGIAVIPLFVVPGLLKKSVDAAGNIGAKLNGIGDKIQGAGAKRATKAYDNSRVAQFKKYRSGQKDLRRAQIQSGVYSGSNRNPLNWKRNLQSRANAAYNNSNLSGQFGDRAAATGVALEHKEFDEEVGRQKTTLTSTGVADTVDANGKVTKQGLASIMRDTNASAERRAAAAGQIMKVGSDKDIQNALDYLGTTDQSSDAGISSIQKQVAADMGSRKPTSLGASDVSSLSTGTYSGDFDSKIAKKIENGKYSAESLAQTSSDELDRIFAHIQTNGSTLKANPKTAGAMKALEDNIAEFRTNPQMQGKQPAHEITSRMDAIHGELSK